jgi:hypothetical protein
MQKKNESMESKKNPSDGEGFDLIGGEGYQRSPPP